MRRKTLRWPDLLLGVAVVALFFSLPSMRSQPTGPKILKITSAVAEHSEPLTPDRLVRVKGPLGETVIAVGGDRARIVESPCAAKLCVRMGWVAAGSGSAICAPNRIAVEIVGEGGVDALLR